MNNQRVLVAGGTGFIGSNLANYLAADNDVVVVDDCYLGTEDNLVDDIEFVKASVVDSELPTDVDVVFHLAALSSYAMHEDDPQTGARVNVEGFVNVVERLVRTAVRRLCMPLRLRSMVVRPNPRLNRWMWQSTRATRPRNWPVNAMQSTLRTTTI
jgi:nucleoside-diphosphate-sugar epimerase